LLPYLKEQLDLSFLLLGALAANGGCSSSMLLNKRYLVAPPIFSSCLANATPAAKRPQRTVFPINPSHRVACPELLARGTVRKLAQTTSQQAPPLPRRRKDPIGFSVKLVRAEFGNSGFPSRWQGVPGRRPPPT
jgi:hypothetical protein